MLLLILWIANTKTRLFLLRILRLFVYPVKSLLRSFNRGGYIM